MIVKVVHAHDGPLDLPMFQVVKEVIACDNCCATKDEVIKSFDTYAEADVYCNALVQSGEAADKPMRLYEPHGKINSSTACGEEQP
jgi:hypothetical protein